MKKPRKKLPGPKGRKRTPVSKTGSRNANRRSSLQIERDRAFIAELYLQGYRLDGITGKLNARVADVKYPDVVYTLSRDQVFRDLRQIRKKWAESQVFNFDEFLNRELDKIDLIEREAWNAWERSKSKRVSNRLKRVEDQVEIPGGEDINAEGDLVKRNARLEFELSRREQTSIISEREGNPVFLDKVMACIQLRLKLLGDTYSMYLQRRAVVLNADTGEEESLTPTVQFRLPHNTRKDRITGSE